MCFCIQVATYLLLSLSQVCGISVCTRMHAFWALHIPVSRNDTIFHGQLARVEYLVPRTRVAVCGGFAASHAPRHRFLRSRFARGSQQI